MKKPYTRLYPVDINRIPWETPAGAPEGVYNKTLAQCPETGSHTRLLKVEPFVDTGIFRHDHWEEVWLLTGSYKNDDEFQPTGTYTCKPPDIDHGPFQTNEGYTGIEVRNYYPAAMNKPLIRLFPLDIERLPWEQPAGAPEGVWQKILARCPETGSHTRLLRVAPGIDTPAAIHDHWEEVYVLAGSYKAGEEFHPRGTYICRPPQVEHGPFLTDEGYLCLEIRDYV